MTPPGPAPSCAVPSSSAPSIAAPSCAAIVLAAGAGTRMGPDLPKPLRLVAGRAMVLRVLDVLAAIDADPVVVVVGHEAERVRAAVVAEAPHPDRLVFVTQPEQRGTGDAAGVGMAGVEGTEVLVLPGDAPLLRPSTLLALVELRRRSVAAASLLSAHFADPTGYGRIVRTPFNTVAEIVEQRDATPQQVEIREINAGVYCFEAAALRGVLGELAPDNSQSEYYLTDAIGMLTVQGATVSALRVDDPTEIMGANDADQLAACSAAFADRAVVAGNVT